MRAVWSRAGQLQGSHYRAGLRAADVSTAQSCMASPGRRKVRASEVFTACYSAIMATAAVIDAGRKDRRRDELDRQIDEAKNSLADLMEETSAHDMASILRSSKSLDSRSLRRSESLPEVMVSLCLRSWEEIYDNHKDQLARKRRVRQMRAQAFYVQGKKIYKHEGKNILDQVQEFILKEECSPHISQREPLNGTQLLKVHETAEFLVESLLQGAYKITAREFPRVFFAPPSSIDSPSSAIRLLKSDGYPRYDHPALQGVDAVGCRRELNEILRSIMRQWDAPRRQHHVAKICYNLLVCPVPPGISNYNALIAGFTELGEHELAEIVVEFFLFMSHLKPTQATYLCLLNHHRLKRDVVGFYNIIRRLCGYDTRGIGLGRRGLNDVTDSPALEGWTSTVDTYSRKGYVNQRASIDQEALTVILCGLIDFRQLSDAAKVFVVFLQDNYKIDVTLMYRLVYAVTSVLDYDAARILFNGFLNHMERTTTLLVDAQLRRPARHHLRLLALMCVGHSGTQGLSQSPLSQNVELFITLLFIRDKISFMTKFLTTMDRPVLRWKTMRWEDRLDRAIAGAKTVGAAQDIYHDTARNFQRMLTLDRLHGQYSKLKMNTEVLKRQYCWIVATSTSPLLEKDILFKSYVCPDVRPTVHEQLEMCETVTEQLRMCFLIITQLQRDLKYALLAALPPSYRERERKQASGMTIDQLQLDRLLAVFLKYLAAFPAATSTAVPVLNKANASLSRESSDALTHDGFVRSLSGMVRSYAGSALARTTG